MNICLQIGIGLIPGTVAALLLLIKRRAFALSKIMMTLLLLGGCSAMLFLGIREVMSKETSGPGLSQKNLISFANALVLEGAYEEALAVIGEYSESYGYDDACRLLTARISLLDADYERANGLYQYLCEQGLLSGEAEEVQLAALKCDADVSALVMTDYLESVGKNPEEYGYTKAAYQQIQDRALLSDENVKLSIHKAMKQSYAIDSALEDCAKAVARVAAFPGRVEQTEEAAEHAQKLRRSFSRMEEESPALFSLECVKKARIKAYVMAGDYDGLTMQLDKNASYHELMVAAELYMGGLVRQRDFSEEYHIVNDAESAAVANQLNKIYEALQDSLSVQERKKLKARVRAVQKQLDDPVLTAMKEQLRQAVEKEAGADQTKVYLELAKVEHYFGNETSTDNYLSEAIYRSQDCADDSYVSAMSQIIHVISNDEDSDSEHIKYVSGYVDTVLAHSLTVDVEAVVSPMGQRADVTPVPERYDTERTASDFARAAADYVSRAKGAVSIGKIDVSDFAQITARVQISSDYMTNLSQIKQGIRVYDCHAEITEFDLRKIDYTGSNIMLVCDVSGSMSGSIQDLRDAVAAFVTDQNANEALAVVTFNESIVETKDFGTKDESMIAFAEGMTANGGTDMYTAVVSCLNRFPVGQGENNVLILMTDGQDNNPRTKEEMDAEIGRLAAEYGVTIYTLGLGSEVDTGYLNTIAGSGNGKFVYVSDSASLTSFYDMLHEQVYNQYEITYQAQDTMTMSGRTLEISLPMEKARDVRSYSLEGAQAGEEADSAVTQGLSVSGLTPRYLYKGLQATPVLLKGSGFEKNSSITVKLDGNMDYTLKAEFVDTQTYRLMVPASVAAGSYHVEVTINGKFKRLQNGFTVLVQGEEKKTAFGPYVFTSSEKVENLDGSYTLRGAVTMNDWLHFKGEITLLGDLEQGGSVTVSDYAGSYVEFDGASAKGLGSFLAEKGIAVDLPALYDFKLYNDQEHLYDYEKYLVDDISTGVLAVHQLLHFKSPKIRLYPNSIGIYYTNGTTQLPYQDQILKACGSTAEIFQFSVEGSAQITKENMGIVLEAEYGDPSESKYDHKVNLLNTPVYFNGSVKAKIDTIQNEYMLGAMIRLAFFADQSGLGAELEWKGFTIDSVKLELELAQAVKLPTTIPIEVNEFSFQVSDIKEAMDNGTWTALQFTGSASFTSLQVKEYFPALERFVGDISLFEMPDTTASIKISPFRLEADAKLNFLSEITLAEAGVKLGNFDYTNSLLQLDNVNVNGLSASLKTGFMWESENGDVSLEVSGTGELDGHSRFVGLQYTGTAAYEFQWWILSSKSKQTGTMALGLYTTSEGRLQLIFAYRTQESDGKVKGSFYYIDENGKCGKKNGTLH